MQSQTAIRRLLTPKFVAMCFLMTLIFVIASQTHTIICIDKYGRDKIDLGEKKAFLTWEKSVQDFSLHYNFAKYIREGATLNPYSMEGQKEIYEKWWGEKTDNMMLSSYFPSFYWIIGWFHQLSTKSFYLIWSISGIIVISLLYLKVYRPSHSFFEYAFIFIATFNLTSIWIHALGQISWLTSLFLGYILYLNQTQSKVSSPTLIVSLGFLWTFVCSKPPLGILAVILMSLGGHYRLIAAGLIILVAELILFSLPLDGIKTLQDYPGFVQEFVKYQFSIPDALNFFIHFHKNFTSILLLMGIPTIEFAMRISQPIFLSFSGLFFALGITNWIGKTTAGFGIVLTYLTFSPYLVVSEDFLLAPTLWIFYKHAPKYKYLFLIISGVALNFNYPNLDPFPFTYLTWIAKLGAWSIIAHVSLQELKGRLMKFRRINE